MAVGTPGSMENKEMGFTPDDSSVLTVDGTTVGYLDEDATVEVPTERAFVVGSISPIKQAKTRQDMTIACVGQETLVENMSHAWDLPVPVSGVVTIDDQASPGVQAILVNTNPPNNAGSDTRVVSMPTGIGNTPGTYTIAKAASGDTVQTLAMGWMALGNTASNALLGTVTDVYV